jgi:hypothetical protein
MDELEKEGDWAIVLTACGPFLGMATRQFDERVELKSAWEIKLVQLNSPQGPVTQRHLFPVLLFSSEVSISLVDIGLVWVRDMSDTDRGDIFKLVRQARDNMIAVRAAQAGISLATTLPSNKRS